MATIDNSSNFFPPFHENVQKALEELLSEKHLYQRVRIDDDFVEPVSRRFPVTGPSNKIALQREALNKIGASLFESCDWEPSTTEPNYLFGLGNNFDNTRIPIQLPTIITECNHCKKRWPFNPVESGTAAQRQSKQNGDQWLLFSYECQACKKEPVRFLVRRQKQKLTLCGRDPMEPVSVPDVIPNIHKVRFGNAIIAYQSGHTLSAIFGLRVFIEQHWRSI